MSKNHVDEILSGMEEYKLQILKDLLEVKHRQQIYDWKRKGTVPPKYAIRFCRLTGAKLKDVCPSMLR